MMPFYLCQPHPFGPGLPETALRRGGALVCRLSLSSSMTLLASGISMYSMGLVLETFFGWDFNTQYLDHRRRGLRLCRDGWADLGDFQRDRAIRADLGRIFPDSRVRADRSRGLGSPGGNGSPIRAAELALPAGRSLDRVHIWSTLADPMANTMGMHWLGIIFGLYFSACHRLLVHRFPGSAARAHHPGPAQRTDGPGGGLDLQGDSPVIVILPGLIGFVLIFRASAGEAGDQRHGNYNAVLPLLMKRYFGPGMIGIGISP